MPWPCSLDNASTPSYPLVTMRNYKRLRKQLNTQETVKCDACHLWFPPSGIEIHHRDGDSANDDPGNFRILCRRCHRQKTNLQRYVSDSISA